MSIRLTAAFAPLASLALAACNTGLASQNRSLDSVHQPVVTLQNLTLDIAAGGGLSPVDEARAKGWFDAIGLGYGDRVAVDPGTAYDVQATNQAVARLVGRYGLLLSPAAPVTTGAIAPGMARIVVSRSTASVPGCPDWGTRSQTDFNSATSSNYGCASNANLAAMVADPQDLVKGQAGALSDPATATKAITTYRTRKPSGEAGLAESSTTGDE